MVLLLVLALTIVFWGGAPLCYLQSHHRTSGYRVSANSGNKNPWCKAHLRMAFVILSLLAAALFAAFCGAAWIVLTDLWMRNSGPTPRLLVATGPGP